MTFHKQNPDGFIVQPLVTEPILNGWNRNIARAFRDGVYTPVKEITIDRFGSTDLQNVNLGNNATLERDPAGKWPALLSVIDWDALAFGHIFDTSDGDLVMSDGTALTGNHDVILRNAVTGGTPLPQLGDILRFSRPLNGASLIRFFNGVVLTPQRQAIFPSAYTNQVGGSPFYVSFHFDGVDWAPLENSGDVQI